MTQLLLALGTNTMQEENMRRGMALVLKLLPQARFTSVMRTKAVGIKSDDFLNCLAAAETEMTHARLRQQLKRIERQCGSTPEKRQQNIVEMDIDILEYNHERFHKKDWEREYIQKLYGEINNPKSS